MKVQKICPLLSTYHELYSTNISIYHSYRIYLQLIARILIRIKSKLCELRASMEGIKYTGVMFLFFDQNRNTDRVMPKLRVFEFRLKR